MRLMIMHLCALATASLFAADPAPWTESTITTKATASAPATATATAPAKATVILYDASGAAGAHAEWSLPCAIGELDKLGSADKVCLLTIVGPAGKNTQRRDLSDGFVPANPENKTKLAVALRSLKTGGRGDTSPEMPYALNLLATSGAQVCNLVVITNDLWPENWSVVEPRLQAAKKAGVAMRFYVLFAKNPSPSSPVDALKAFGSVIAPTN